MGLPPRNYGNCNIVPRSNSQASGLTQTNEGCGVYMKPVNSFRMASFTILPQSLA